MHLHAMTRHLWTSQKYWSGRTWTRNVVVIHWISDNTYTLEGSWFVDTLLSIYSTRPGFAFININASMIVTSGGITYNKEEAHCLSTNTPYFELIFSDLFQYYILYWRKLLLFFITSGSTRTWYHNYIHRSSV